MNGRYDAVMLGCKERTQRFLSVQHRIAVIIGVCLIFAVAAFPLLVRTDPKIDKTLSYYLTVEVSTLTLTITLIGNWIERENCLNHLGGVAKLGPRQVGEAEEKVDQFDKCVITASNPVRSLVSASQKSANAVFSILYRAKRGG